MKYNQILQFQKILHYSLLIFLAVIFFSPFVWLISTSLKDTTQIINNPREFFPGTLHFENFFVIFQKYALATFLKNTFYVAFFSVVGNVLVSTLAGYALARLVFKGRDFLFMATLGTMFVPLFLIIIPRFIIFNKVEMIGTLLPLIIPSALGSPFCIFLLRQFLRGIPKELSEAAVIDGCHEFGIYWRIIMPLAKPAIIAVVIFTVQWRWNEFIEPLIYLQDEELFTITIGLYQIMGSGAEEISTHLVMAAVVVTVAPIVLIFLFAQKYFVEGVSTTGLKG